MPNVKQRVVIARTEAAFKEPLPSTSRLRAAGTLAIIDTKNSDDGVGEVVSIRGRFVPETISAAGD